MAATVTLVPIADTYVNEAQPTINYSGSPNLEVARFGEFLTVWRSYLRFDLSSVPPNAIIESAELRLYLNSLDGNHGGHPDGHSYRYAHGHLDTDGDAHRQLYTDPDNCS